MTLHVSAGAVARDFPNPQVDIGMASIMRDANNLLEAWRTICQLACALDSGLGCPVILQRSGRMAQMLLD